MGSAFSNQSQRLLLSDGRRSIVPLASMLPLLTEDAG